MCACKGRVGSYPAYKLKTKSLLVRELVLVGNGMISPSESTAAALLPLSSEA